MKSRKAIRQSALAVALASLVLAPAALAGDRLVVRVQEPFEVNGHVYPAGEMSLREVSDYSPVATLNEICVDGTCLGMLLAQETAAGPIAARDEVTFTRSADGHLVLQSLARRGQRARELSVLQPDGVATLQRPLLVAAND